MAAPVPDAGNAPEGVFTPPPVPVPTPEPAPINLLEVL